MKPNTKSLKYLVEVSMERGVMQEHQLTNTTWEQELEARTQAILQWVSETVVGRDEPGVTNIMIAIEHERQRQILRREGLKDE